MKAYGRDLDLNLLRVFLAVVDRGSVTGAAAALYLTQPAVSAALRRLRVAIGAPLFARQGRSLRLTSRGARLFAEVKPHLTAIVDAALRPPTFDAETSERTLRLGLSDAAETWLLPPLLAALDVAAPRMRLVVVPVQFRTVGDALTGRRIDAAVTVADDLPSGVRRRRLFVGDFVCLFDPRKARIGRALSERAYFERAHVVVSYAGDLRGVVEDATRKERRVRCSVSSFANVAAVVEGSALLATVPRLVADQILRSHPGLRVRPLPFELPGTPMELLWSSADDDDPAVSFLLAEIVRVAARARR